MTPNGVKCYRKKIGWNVGRIEAGKWRKKIGTWGKYPWETEAVGEFITHHL